jgi:FtsP/CotA-like multicopper oxidase with cupredoxin domain
MDQEAATIWYHDHAMGVTHNNTQMGLAGFFPITDANEQALIAANILPSGAYELGFALQDRMFDTNGQFAMPDAPVIDAAFPACDPTNGTTRLATCSPLFMKAADGHLIPYDLPTMVDPSGINLDAPFLAASTSLEYFGNMPVVNGVTYGKYDVEPRVYRMRFIGGTDSRTWVMQLVTRGTGTVIPFWQIGSEQGFLDNPVPRDTMDLLPGERLDVLVDLTGIPAGTKIVMKNIGPDMPYGGPDTLLDPLYEPSVDIPEIMEFDVIGLTGSDAITTPSAATNLRPVSGAIVPLVPTPGTPIRNVSLVEGIDQYGRTMPSIDGRGFMQMGVPITEVIRLNDTEEWNIINDTVDAHPIHLHLVAFQVVSRQTYTNFVPAVTDTMAGTFTQPQFTGTGPLLPPAAWEAGWKDTVDCPPGTVTTVRAKFDIAGSRYVWHCHILSHEEHDMMRPMAVVAPSAPVSNILWRNTATGDNAVWNMTGTAMTGSAFLTPLNDPNWKIVGTADFNADGTPDLLWRNTVTGENAVWYMTGTTMTGSAFLPPMYDLNWNIVGTADFNANGMPDLLWRNTVTGDNAVWYMNGATMTGSAFLTPLNDPNWNIVGTADFNADGTPDLFWRNNTTGDNAVWYITGTTMTGSAFLSPLYDLNWNIVGVGDYNADGTPDLFWRNSTTGDNAVWYMTGTTMTGSAFLTPLYDPNWRIVGLQ